jgi:hypothetical protein
MWKTQWECGNEESYSEHVKTRDRPVGRDIELAVGESEFEGTHCIQVTDNRLVVSFCEHGDGISGFVKGDEFLDCLKSELC